MVDWESRLSWSSGLRKKGGRSTVSGWGMQNDVKWGVLDGAPHFQAYGTDWMQADDSLRVLGQCCLELLEKALHDYLREFARREFGMLGVYGAETNRILDQRLRPYRKRDGWFRMYVRFLEQRMSFKWSPSPVQLSQLEQINLTRNDIAHDPQIDNTCPLQSDDHFTKYPTPAFADPVWLSAMTRGGKEKVPLYPVAIYVNHTNFTTHIGYVRQFCVFVEAHRKPPGVATAKTVDRHHAT